MYANTSLCSLLPLKMQSDAKLLFVNMGQKEIIKQPWL